MLAKRQFQVKVVGGNVAYLQNAAANVIMDVVEDRPVKEIIATSQSSAAGSVASLGVVNLLLPKGYTSASQLFVSIRANGIIQVDMTSPEHSASKIMVYGNSGQWGTLSFSERVMSISITNPTAAAVNIDCNMIMLPDISLEASFRGLQSTGAMTSIYS